MVVCRAWWPREGDAAQWHDVGAAPKGAGSTLPDGCQAGMFHTAVLKSRWEM